MPVGGAKTQRRKMNQTRRRGLKRVKITKTVTVPPMKDTLKAQVLTVAKRATARAIPNRVIGWNVESIIDHNCAISNADCYPLVQQISLGDEIYERQGDRLKPKSLTVKGHIALNPDNNPDTSAMYVRVIIAQQKTVRSVGNYANLDTAHLLKPCLAGAPEQPFNGNEIELAYPVNRDLFRVYMDKVFLITPASAASGNPRTGAQKKWSYRFKQMPSTLTFDQGGGDYVNNFAPFVALGYAYADANRIDTIATRIQHSVFSQLTFEDA